MISSAVLLLAALAAAQTTSSVSSSAASSSAASTGSSSSTLATSASVSATLSATATQTGGLSQYTIDPNDPLVDTKMRAAWCTAQLQTCPQLCPNGAFPNTCTASTLKYECKCNDGTTPNLADYEQTIPFFECQQYIAECVSKTNDADAQQQCRAIKCGPKGPPAARASQISASLAAAQSTSASSASSSASASSTAVASAATTSNSRGGSAPTGVAQIGSGAVLGGLAALGLLL